MGGPADEQAAPTRERAYRARCYPTKPQMRLLAQLLGAKRFVWNWALARRREAYAAGEKIGFAQLSRELTELCRQPGYEWLGALPREPLTQVLRDLERAYSNFFAGRAKFPRFKRRAFAGAPSSKKCSNSHCGWINEELKLSDRFWTCRECGAEHDRDINAAKNILAEALRMERLAAGYREEHGKLRARSVGAADGSLAAEGHGTLNRELIAKPAVWARRRQACREQAKAPTA